MSGVAVNKRLKARKSVGRKPGTPIDSPERRAAFLKVLSDTGNVQTAAESIDVLRSTVYNWRRKDKEFSKAWDEALDIAADRVEAVFWDRVINGVEEPVFYQGKQVATVRKYDNRALLEFLKAAKPDKYREKGIPDGQIVIQISGADEIKELRQVNPWRADEAVEDGEFKPVSIKTQDANPRSVPGLLSSPKKKGLSAQEIAEQEENE